MEERWVEVDDAKIIHTWVKPDDDDCENEFEDVQVHPDFYQENGTPVCPCGRDLVYSHTEVLIHTSDSLKISNFLPSKAHD